MAETVRRQGTPDQDTGGNDTPDSDTLQASQRDALATTGANAQAAATARPLTAIRRYTGDKRTQRVGPLRFTPAEHRLLHAAAAEHGYKGASGFAADIVLAFLTGRFTSDLPLSEDRRNVRQFRAQTLRAVNRIGVNVNQIARTLNTGDHAPADLRDHLDELHHLLTLIARALSPSGEAEEPTGTVR